MLSIDNDWTDEQYRGALDEQCRATHNELPPEATRVPIALWSRLRHDLDRGQIQVAVLEVLVLRYQSTVEFN